MSDESQPSAKAPRCLVDTDVLSYVVHGDTRAEAYRAYFAGKELGVSFQVVAELRRWGRTHRWGPTRWQQRQLLLARITVYLVDDALIDAWAYITAARDHQGRPIATGDAWIAATAWLQALPLLTLRTPKGVGWCSVRTPHRSAGAADVRTCWGKWPGLVIARYAPVADIGAARSCLWAMTPAT